jgi:cyclohexadieny/prephenate dehydrogenase
MRPVGPGKESTAVSEPLFDTACFVGIGHIGASMALAMRKHGLVRRLVALEISAEAVREALELGVVDAAGLDPAELVPWADLVVVAVPVGAVAEVGRTIAPHLAPGTIVTDVGSVKVAVIRELGPTLPPGVVYVPGHPIAGRENSGPSSGIADLFEGRWQILTPLPETDPAAIARLSELWTRMGSMVETMDPEHHDRVLAITSHLPHLIAYTIVGTASDLESHLAQEVIKFSASGFRDFTRIAASDPVMWRDIFLNNREAVLDVIQRFTEDLTALQRAIRWGEGQVLEEKFTQTRAIRRAVIDARQA